MKGKDLKVVNVMNRTLFTVPYTATFEEVLDTILENRISAIIVVAENSEFMGIISKTDILLALKKFREKVFEMKAEDLLNPKPYTIDGDATLEEAASKMVANKIHRLLVISPSVIGKFIPVGIVTATDILKKIAIKIY
ncbi:MAG: CBS domain-containing protein [Caldimicrobium sp.]